MPADAPHEVAGVERDPRQPVRGARDERRRRPPRPRGSRGARSVMRAETFSEAPSGRRCAARRSAHRSSSSSTVCTPSSPASRIRLAVASAWSPAVAPPKRASRRPEPSCQAASSESASSGSRASWIAACASTSGSSVAPTAVALPTGLGCSRTVTRHDQPERPVGAGEQLGEVVARDVLDHLAAGLGERAVRERERDADDQVAHAAVAVAQRAGVAGRDHAADGRRVARRPAAGRARASGPPPRTRPAPRRAARRPAAPRSDRRRCARGSSPSRRSRARPPPARRSRPSRASCRRRAGARPCRPRRASAAAWRPPPASRAARWSPSAVATPQNLSASPAASSGWIR